MWRKEGETGRKAPEFTPQDIENRKYKVTQRDPTTFFSCFRLLSFFHLKTKISGLSRAIRKLSQILFFFGASVVM